MAFVSELDRLTRDSQKRHGGIRGTYFTFEQDGIRYLQIDTRGSGERQEKGKTSQTIQIGPEIARLLLPELQRVAASDGGAATPFSGHDSAGKPADVSKLRGSASRFETALQLAGYNWRTDLVRAFVAALLAKRFVVLAGVTGSGKSRLALALGEWLGEGRSLMVSVRPDWTGPEAILGFEDLLSRDGNGSRPWQVPDVLAFMAKAARTPAEPFLLILDE
ncbi:ATP-binding protein, partial [bacterium]|nr:ATP-binding protein [bacterium]